MSKKHYGESMAQWEREQEEREWQRKCDLAIKNNDREKAMVLIEEGVDNAYDADTILMLKKL